MGDRRKAPFSLGSGEGGWGMKANARTRLLTFRFSRRSSPLQPCWARSSPPGAWHRSAPPSRPPPTPGMPRMPRSSSGPRRFLPYCPSSLPRLGRGRPRRSVPVCRRADYNWYATSPCVVVSRPRTSSCSGTRRPTVISTTLRMIQVTAAVNAPTAATATACFSNCPGLP